MFVSKKGTQFCDCGRIIENCKGKLLCPKCKDKIDKKEREKIGRYSGFSNRMKGAYEKD